MAANVCYHCESDHSAQLREYVWHYRPRNRYRGLPWLDVDSEDILQVSLCNLCHNATYRANGTLIELTGWDWQDAYDGIHGMLWSVYHGNLPNHAQVNLP